MMLYFACRLETLSGLPEGDIVLTPEQQSAIEVEANSRSSNGPQNAVVRNMMSLWRDQTLVYVLDPSLSESPTWSHTHAS